MNFFLQALLATFIVVFVRAADLQVNAPLSFGLSLSDALLDVIAISVLVAIVVVPLVMGLLYAKVLIARLRAETKKKPVEDAEGVEAFFHPVEISQSSRTFKSRLSDMKTNAVLRLWWKKQHKIHGVALIEADVEAQSRRLRSQLTDKSAMSKQTNKSDPVAKSEDHANSHHKHKKKKDVVVSP